MVDHDRLLSGRLRMRFGPEARRRAAEALAVAMSEVLTVATAEAVEVDVPGDDVVILADGLDAHRLLRAIRDELQQVTSE